MRQLPHEVKLSLYAIAFGAAGVGLIALGGIGKPAGEALIIAAALAVSVDRYVKLKLRDEIARDVFFAALGVHLPAELKREVLALSEYRLARQDFHVTYTITRNENPQLVNCKIDVAFTMHNFTDLPEKFVHQLSVVDAPAGAINLPMPILSVKGEVNGVVAYALSDHEIRVTKSEYASDWKEPLEIGAKQKAKFSSTTQHVLPIDWEDVFIFAEPTIGVTVAVNAPPEFMTRVIFDHRVGSNVQPDTNGNWVLKEACLPNTLFRTNWKIRQAKQTTSAVDALAATQGATQPKAAG